MFSFLSMADSYEQRKVANTEVNGAVIDTAAVTDSSKPYETGVRHPRYNRGEWVIVELYDTKTEAKAGHEKWVKIFTKTKLPKKLTDVNDCGVCKLAEALGAELPREFEEIPD